jgi:hypothetical protein
MAEDKAYYYQIAYNTVQRAHIYNIEQNIPLRIWTGLDMRLALHTKIYT